MSQGEQRCEPGVGSDQQRAGFIFGCGGAFVASAAVTVYFCRSMCCEMEMPGGWTMSMMWMPKPGHAWAASITTFLFMWLAMMVAMMMPSALPRFVHTRRTLDRGGYVGTFVSLPLMACGYFAMWLAVGAGVYLLGIGFTDAAMRWESFSRVIPVFAGLTLIAAGAVQFTRWKMSCLLCCRSPLGCAPSGCEREASFRLGCKQGAACCLCCATLIMVQLSLGVMNPLLMIGIAVVIAAEKLLPRPDITVRIVGIAALALGIKGLWHGVILG
jgi:predicted metal-binding membrane protein